MKNNLYWFIVIGFAFFGVSCSLLGNVPVAPSQHMYLPLVANEKAETSLAEVPVGDGFKTVFLFSDEGNVKETLSWAEGATRLGMATLSLSLLVIVSTVAGVIKAKGFRKFTTLVAGGLFLFFWMRSAISWVEIGQERQKEQEQEYQALLDIYNQQQYQMAEGQVEVLHTQPSGGHDAGDLLKIGGVELEVDYFLSTFGYRQTISHGGALTNGVYARLFYTGPTILRVDVKEE